MVSKSKLTEILTEALGDYDLDTDVDELVDRFIDFLDEDGFFDKVDEEEDE